MTLEPGQKLHHYELIEVIGKGGMGVVWRARDTSLRREVALKLLTPGLVDTSELRHRFLREARAAAAISHPHIATVFEVGEFENQPYIAMELVKGDTLRSRIEPGALPIGDALGVVCEVADGLTHAHRSGVIHRDLKPENVMIGEDGHVRILDFGLAKIAETETHDSDPAEAKTITERLTRLGKVMGTAAYMSPEQARGQQVDARTDVFSFGAVLYESVTGQLPFRGATPLDTLTAVINNEPRAPSLLNERVPPELERIVRKCLQKKPDERYQDTGDLLVDLRQLRRETESQPLAMPPQRKTWRRSRIPRLAILGAVLAAVFYGVFQVMEQRKPAAPEFPTIEQRMITNNTVDTPVAVAYISPSGRYLAYTDRNGLHVKILESGEIKDFEEYEGWYGGLPVGWFPDETRLLITRDADEADPTLCALSILTGNVQTIREGAQGLVFGGAVSPDGNTLAFASSEDEYEGIWLMGVDGSRPRLIVEPDAEKESLGWWIRWSPDSQRILYRRQVVQKDGYKNALETCDLEGGSRTVVLPPQLHIFPGIHAIWSPDNRIVLARTESGEQPRDANLWAIDIDPVSGEPLGEPRRLTAWYGFFVLGMTSTDAGDMAMLRMRTQTEIGVAGLDREAGRRHPAEPVTNDAMDDVFGAWLPDGESLLFSSNRRGGHDIYRKDLATGRTTAVITGPDEDVVHDLTPDGEWLLYAVREDAAHVPSLSPWTLHRATLTGGSPLQIGMISSRDHLQCGRAPGSRCVVSRLEGETERFLEIDPMSGDEELLAEAGLAATGRSEYEGWSLSPDGKRVAWTGNRDDTYHVGVLDLEGGALQTIALPDSLSFGYMAWDISGEAFLSVAYPDRVVVRIGLDGSVANFEPTGNDPLRALGVVPSPDGSRVAFVTTTSERTVWRIRGY